MEGVSKYSNISVINSIISYFSNNNITKYKYIVYIEEDDLIYAYENYKGGNTKTTYNSIIIIKVICVYIMITNMSLK